MCVHVHVTIFIKCHFIYTSFTNYIKGYFKLIE